uniref:HDC03020 n=1 Tax=Drosophila melanogaster TaxID=7227 RepID=Q6IH84_DROME|nr:TPA_inf: HDC03020 [Drosophila melanogaster]
MTNRLNALTGNVFSSGNVKARISRALLKLSANLRAFGKVGCVATLAIGHNRCGINPYATCGNTVGSKAAKQPAHNHSAHSHTEYNGAVATLNTCWLQISRTTCCRGSMRSNYNYKHIADADVKSIRVRRPETPQAVHLQSTGVNNNGYLSAMPGIEIFRLHGYIYTWTWRYIRKFVHPRLVDVGAHTVSAPFAVTSPVCTSSDGDDIAAKSVHAAQDLCISPVFPTLFVRPGRGCDMSFLWLMSDCGQKSGSSWPSILPNDNCTAFGACSGLLAKLRSLVHGNRADCAMQFGRRLCLALDNTVAMPPGKFTCNVFK